MSDRPPDLPLFVYGTLRPGLRNHARFLAGRCERARPAVLAGTALHDGPGYPFAVPDPAHRVHGDLLAPRPEEYAGVLAALDRLEGCHPDGSGLYIRIELPVTPAGGDPVSAWVYLAGPAWTARLRTTPALIPSGDWTQP